jgi:hypothetical protein
METLLDWTHKNLEITDIRKIPGFYIFTASYKKGNSFESENYKSEDVLSPLMVKDKIFEERLRPYFLKDVHRVSREEILSVKWNMYITKGYFIKISGGEIHQYDKNPEKYYVSYLEIAGPLGTFQSICEDKELH